MSGTLLVSGDRSYAVILDRWELRCASNVIRGEDQKGGAHGRVAVVTDGTRGIGRAVSITLKNAGYNVAANYGGNDKAAQHNPTAIAPLCVRPMIMGKPRKPQTAAEGNLLFTRQAISSLPQGESDAPSSIPHRDTTALPSRRSHPRVVEVDRRHGRK
jgi:hypothetical protein